MSHTPETRATLEFERDRYRDRCQVLTKRLEAGLQSVSTGQLLAELRRRDYVVVARKHYGDLPPIVISGRDLSQPEREPAEEDPTTDVWCGTHHRTRRGMTDTHCLHGHEMTADNTGRRRDGTRWCRACHHAAQERHRQRKVAAQ